MTRLLIKVKAGEKLPAKYTNVKRITENLYRVEVPERLEIAIDHAVCEKCIERVEEDIKVDAINDPYYSLDPVNETDPMYWQDHINLKEAWKTTKGAGIKIGIIDTGADLDLDEISHAIYASTSITGEASAQDSNGHGTMVASLIVGKDNGKYSVGVAPEAKIAVAKTNTGSEGSFYLSDIIMAMDWCVAQGVHFINMSLGGIGSTPISWQEAINRAVEAGVTVFAASGNHADLDDRIGRPANADNVVAVGSHYRTNRRSSFCAWRDWFSDGKLDIYAPGEKLYVTGINGVMKVGSGTSFSCPIAVGCWALIKAANLFPVIDHDAVRELNMLLGYPTANYIDDDIIPAIKRINLGVYFDQDPLLHVTQTKYSKIQRLEVEYSIPEHIQLLDIEISAVDPSGTVWYLDGGGSFIDTQVNAFSNVLPSMTGSIGLLFGHTWNSDLYNYPWIFRALDMRDFAVGFYSLTMKIYNSGTNELLFPEAVITFELVN